MGRADEYQFDYLDDNRRFADQVNGALFHGRQVVKPYELEPADMQMVYLGKEAGNRKNFKTVVDKTRMWRGRLIHILAVENQSFVDYHMVLRNMLTECLHELLEMDDDVRGLVTNYRLNLYDCHEHDTFDEYHTGLRQLFEVLRYGKDKDKLRAVMEANKEAYSRMDSDTRKLLEVVAKVKIKEDDQIMENGEKKYDLCKAFVDMKLEGSREHLAKAVCIKLQKGKPANVIADELEEELAEIEKVIEAQKRAGSYDAEQVCKMMTE